MYLKELGKTKGKLYFQNYFSVCRKPWFSNVNLPRKSITTINRIRANHYNLAASLARIKVVSDCKCQCSAECEDINHVLWQCKIYDSQREKLINKLVKLKFQLPFTVEIFLHKPHIPASICINQFLSDCKLKI